MIVITTFDYDPNGYVALDARIKNPFGGERRGSVTATLDGGASHYDTGYSESDREFAATLKRPSRAALDRLQYLLAYYHEVRLSMESGCFRVRFSFALDGDTATLKFRALARLDK